MNRTQIIIVALLVTLVVGVFGVLAYLLLNNRRPAVAPAATATLAAPTASTTRRPAPSPTPSRWAGATAASAQEAQKMAQATLQAGAAATAEAESKIQAILRRMPVNDPNLSAENGRLQLAITRLTWLGPGSLALKLRVVNQSQEKLRFELTRLILEDAKGGLNPPDASVNAGLPGGLQAGEIAPGASLEGQVAFKLPLLTAPAALVHDDGQGDALKIDIMAWILKQPKPSATPTR